MEGKVLFSNTSKLNQSNVETFNKIIGKKLTGYGILMICLVCGVIGGLLCIVDLFLGIAVIGVGFVVGIPLVSFGIKDTMKKNAQKLMSGKKYLVHFDFYEDEILLKAEMAEENEKEYTFSGEEVVKYADISKAIVSGTDIYIQRGGQANILDQKGMTQGTAGELIEFLKSKGVKVQKI